MYLFMLTMTGPFFLFVCRDWVISEHSIFYLYLKMYVFAIYLSYHVSLHSGFRVVMSVTVRYDFRIKTIFGSS
jgi:hypothetical protein